MSGSGTTRHSAALRASGGLTLKQAFDRCLRSNLVWGRIKASREYARNCRTIEGILGANKPLESIDAASIRKLVDTLTKRDLSPATVNRHLACLRRMFNVALGSVSDPWADAPKLFPKVSQLKERGAREYFMEPEDEAALFAEVLRLDDVIPGPQLGPPRKFDAHRYHALFVVLVESGMRLNEALGLSWNQVRAPASGGGMFLLHKKAELKTGKPRSIPITEAALVALQSCKEIEGGPFADLNDRRAQSIWTRAKEAAGITHQDAVIHSLRHTCACRLLKAGVDLFVVMDWLGHSSITTTQGYRHLQTDQLTAAAVGLDKLRRDVSAAPELRAGNDGRTAMMSQMQRLDGTKGLSV